MKYRIALPIILIALLSACNFTLAEDVTPPPGYIAPTPLPTLVLYPQQVPSIANGAAIYVTKCAPCHGETGLGDGPQGIQLGVTVPAFALAEIARPLSPAQMYTTVTRGVMDRFMPPFASLNDQERWDVVAYVMSLHTNNEEIQKGRELFEANCKDCSTEYYKNQTNMSALSTVALARIVRLGNDDIKAFGEKLSDDEMWAVAEYLRSLSFDASPLAQPTVVPATQTPVAAEGTPIEGTQQAQVQEGFGSVSGSVDNKTGETLPADMSVILHGFDHNTQDPNNTQGPQEVLTLNGTVLPDGTFVFDKVEMPANRLFTAEVMYNGVGIETEITVVTAGQADLILPAVTLYKTTNDASTLVVDQLHIFLDASSDTEYQVLALYTFHNSSQTIVAIPMGNQQEIPFLKYPTGSKGLGYQAMQDSAAFISTSDGFAIPPSDKTYGIIAISSITKQKETTITQPLTLPVSSVSIFIPDGIELKGDLLTKGDPQNIQGSVYQLYSAGNLKAGDELTFTASGSPKAPSTASSTSKPLGVNSNLLIGAGGLGIALILVGAWMFLRDRKPLEEDGEGDEDKFESSEDVMDAIIALDDLHRAKKISDEAYQKRRAELKGVLKEMT